VASDSVVSENLRHRGSARLAFTVCAFVPAMLLFFPPLAFYKLPMQLQLYGGNFLVYPRSVWTAVAAAAVWFTVAIGVFWWPTKSTAAPRSWPLPVAAAAFVWFSIIGSIVAVGTSLCQAPGALAELVHWVAFAPVVAMVIGVSLYRQARDGARLPMRSWLLPALAALDLCAVVLWPIALARVEPAAVAMIAIFYGLWALRLSRRALLLTTLILCGLIAFALPVKEFLREALYDNGPFVSSVCAAARTTKAVPATNVVVNVGPALQSYPHLVAVSSPSTFGLRWKTLRGPLGYVQYTAARTVNRLNRLGDFAYVVQTTPSQIPYAHGLTYIPIIGTVIPRALWPNKPQNNGAGQFYGHRYGYLDPRDLTHSANLPIVTEGWVNYGWLGVIFSAVVVGLVLHVIWQRWIGNSNGLGNVMIGMAVMATAVDQESSLGLFLGGVVHALVIYGVLAYLLWVLGASASTHRRGAATRELADSRLVPDQGDRGGA
jgi:hypothetical protein